MQYKLHLNLRQRAALRTAISFWQKKEVKTEVFESCDVLETKEARKKWGEFTKTIVDEWNKDVLPKKLEDELIHIVKMIGKTMFNWYRYITFEWGVEIEAINFIDEVHWTPYGTMDEVQIFKSSWLHNPDRDITDVYNFACYYAMEDYIDDLWNKMSSDMQDCFYDDSIYDNFDQHILAYWKCCSNGDLSDLMEYFQTAANDFERDDILVFNLLYDLNGSTEENMLRLTVYQGHFIAMKYFWEKLTEEERNKSVLKCARIVVLRYNHYAKENRSFGDYKVSQCVEICVFMMNQMSDDQKKEFFNEKLGFNHSYYFDKADVKDEVLKMLLSTWPWEELFIPVLKDMLQYQDDNSRMACMFLDAITYKMYKDYELDYSLESSKYRYLLRDAWIIIPASIKQKISMSEDSDYEFVNNLVYIWDLDSLKLILNDPEIADVRDKFIDIGSFSYSQLIGGNEFEKLDKFIEEMIRSEEKKKQFKQKINILELIIDNGQFDLADKLLDWQCSTPEERQIVKTNIDHINICEDLIEENHYDLADQLIDWRFDTEEEKKNCKNYFKSDIFSIRHICEIWKERNNDINSAKDECFRFLHWLLDSDEDIAPFKKEITLNLESDEFIMDCLIQLKSDGILVDFMSWCLLDDEQFQRVQQIKQVVSERN